MIEPVNSPPRGAPPTSPQLALRVAVLGGVAFLLFAIIFMRLWFLQVLTGDQYRQQALDNRVRTTAIPAPRGTIVDRNGVTLVENRAATVIQLDPQRLPASERTAALAWEQLAIKREQLPKHHKGEPPPIPPVPTAELRSRFARLAAVIGISPARVQKKVVQQLGSVPYANVRVKVDVPQTMRDYLLEHQREFPGIRIQQVYLRRYPHGSTAAQLLGTTTQVSPDQLKAKTFRGAQSGAIVGQEGLERTYDRYLRGVDGTQSITVDAAGRPKRTRIAHVPQAGRSLRTSLDFDLQQAGQRAMASIIQRGTGTGGAFVALDPRNGQVLAMGSYPSFNPSLLARPISQERYDAIFNGDAANAPRLNRAITGAYPTGSTFKPITALAALERGVITPDSTINDTGLFELGIQKFKNAGGAVNGVISLRRALQVSSDVFFYTLGARTNNLRGQAIQTWARRLGLDRTTGIDLPGEAAGTIPDRAWRKRLNAKEKAYEKVHHNVCPPNCLYSDNRNWSVGDNVNLAVGQGDVQASPLQMAVAYAAIANAGRVVRPHLGVAVEDDAGSQLQGLSVDPRRHVRIDPADRQAIMDGLHMATIGDGTSARVFAGWNQNALPVYGKTGTAERKPKLDQSWYVAYVSHRTRPIVIAATIEQGGFGSDAAAPLTCRMLSRWFHQPKVACAPGGSKTR